jgi:glutathione synthase/RimK-type ligase-like ATP-grasp enzyme
MKPIAILYENEAWMAPLFDALDAERVPVARVFANDLVFDPAGPTPAWSLAVNKVSPSSYLRAHAPSIGVARELLPFLERRGVPVVNGSRAFALETSKARQLVLLAELGIRAPAARVVTDRAQILAAAAELRFPVIVKPNIGGSGALMRRFDTQGELADAIPAIDLGPDGTGLVQEFLESEDGAIRRVEFLGGEYLYAIKIANQGSRDFNLCPADICQVDPPSDFDNCVVEAPAKRALDIEAFDAPAEIVADVLRAARAGGLDVGGIEYLVAARDGLPYIYDINALSNFVTDAERLVGFDPHARFARWLAERAGRRALAAAG